ncbi:MAG: hypothetical protein KIT07_01975 [Anaerolineales bacterium]|jgi:hypothetical protein|nr:hypothetical protein [Anaerolineales bacterium]
MSAQHSPLKKSAELIRAGRLDDARNQLVGLLRLEPNNAQAWYLLSFVLDDPQRKQYALQQALKAQPDFERAQERLQQLRGELPAAPPSQPITPAFSDMPAAPPWEAEQALRVEEPPLPARRSPLRTILLALLAVAVVAALWLLGQGWLSGLGSGGALPPTLTNAPFRTLPAVWTATPQPAGTATTTPASQLTLPADGQALLQTIADQVASVRGLAPSRAVPALLVPPAAAADAVASLAPGGPAAEARMLQALGLLPADGNLAAYYRNRQVDAYAGAYQASAHRVLLLGEQLNNGLSYAYARGVGRAALADQFPEVYAPLQNCAIFDDGCRARLALVQGDANWAAAEWLRGPGAAAFDASSLPQPNYTYFTDPASADVAVLDTRFAAETGQSFVQTLFAAGGWEQVNSAYRNLPSTTEHILHPEKYVANEAALNLQPADLADALGAGWQLQGRGQLGEWLTRLLLAAGADADTRLPEESAVTAAAGWGGDELQVYWRSSDGQLALAQHWLMDDAANGQELHAGVQQYLSQRFGGAPGELGRGRCWQAGGQAACLLANAAEVVWLLLPDDPAVINAALALYPHIP